MWNKVFFFLAESPAKKVDLKGPGNISALDLCSNPTDVQHFIRAPPALDNRLNDGQCFKEIGEQDVPDSQLRAVRCQVVLPITLLLHEEDVGVFCRGYVWFGHL